MNHNIISDLFKYFESRDTNLINAPPVKIVPYKKKLIQLIT